jgi:hypothetical protein
MNRIEVTSVVGSDGILHLSFPLGTSEANKEVRVIIESLSSSISQEEWRHKVLETAGKWQGDFGRPKEGELEERVPLS